MVCKILEVDVLMGNKIKENKKRFFYPDEFVKVLGHLNKNQKFTATCQINMGTRINEARNIEARDLSAKRETIVIRETKVKAKLGQRTPEPRTIKVSSTFFKYIKKNISTHRILSTNAFNIGLREACVKAKVDKPEQFSSHNLRKTFATWMLSLGADGFKLAQYLDHSPAVLMKDYATNDCFNVDDKRLMIQILGNLPKKLINREVML